MRNKLKIEDGVKAILFLILFTELFLTNGLYLILCTLSFYLIFYQLQQPYKSSVFTILFLYHFIQIITGVLLPCYWGLDINASISNMGTSTIACLIGLLYLFFPVIYYQNKIPAINLETLQKHAAQLSIDKTFYVYVISFFVAGVLAGIRFLYPGFSQIIVSLINIKWFLFLLFGFQSILKGKRKKELYIFIIIEIVIGFTGFFSDFKTVMLYTAVLYITLMTTITTKKIITSIGIGTVVFISILFWTNIKGEYRSFLNKGSSTQSVQVSKNEALNKLYALSNKSSAPTFSLGIPVLLDRLQATQNFALTTARVPANLPFENGRHWGETLEFVLTPRILNPNKPTIDYSTKVSKYTGVNHAGLEQGTSFSLGYFADSYIDFGYFGMMIPLLLIGFIYGYTHFYFIKNTSKNFIFNYSIAAAVFMEFFALEMDSTYLLGRLFSTLLTFFLLTKLFFPWLMRYLSEKRETVVKRKAG